MSDCVGKACAAAVGVPFDEFVRCVGHKADAAGFTMGEALGFLYRRGYTLGISPSLFIPVYAEEVQTVCRLAIPPKVEKALREAADRAGVGWGEYATAILRAHFDIAEEKGEESNIIGVTGTPGSQVKKVKTYVIEVDTSQPAILGVNGNKDKHAVFWDGERVIDSNFEEPQDLDGYEVEAWWPLMQIRPGGFVYKGKKGERR